MEAGLRIIIDTACVTLGINRIANIETDESQNAQLLRSNVDHVARTICQEFDFPSARARYKLIKDTNVLEVPPPYTGAYPLPSNYLRLFDFNSQIGDYDIIIDDAANRRVMLANFEPGWIIYSRVPSYDLMDPLLQEAIGQMLAYRLSVKVSESESKAKANQQKALEAFSRAVSASVFERSADIENNSNWLAAMRSY